MPERPSAADSPAPPRGGPPPVPPEVAALDPHVAASSVAELEGLDVQPGAYGMGSTAWLARALVSPIAHLGPAELRLLLSHGRGVRWLLPLALGRLEREPFAAGDHGPGDLLSAVLMVDAATWDANPAWRARLADVVRGARSMVHVLAGDVRERVVGELEAAGEAFGF
jgi:hypothetical protein